MTHGYRINSLLYTREKGSLILKGNINIFVNMLLDSDIEQIYLEVEPFSKLQINVWFVKDLSDNEIYAHIRVGNKILHTKKRIFELDKFQGLIDSAGNDQIYYLLDGKWKLLSESGWEWHNMVVFKQEIVTNLMEQYPVLNLQPNSRDHARYALEQALLDNHINREVYEELMEYVLHVHVLYKGDDA